MFDPNKFMQSNFNGKLDTVIPALLEDDYRAVIDDVTHRQVDTKDGPRQTLRIRWSIKDENKLAAQGRKSASVNQDVWLDLTPDGSLDESEGKNTGLGQLLEALNLNGQPWSPGQLKGMGPAILRIAPRPDQKNPEVVYNDVRRVVKLS